MFHLRRSTALPNDADMAADMAADLTDEIYDNRASHLCQTIWACSQGGTRYDPDGVLTLQASFPVAQFKKQKYLDR